jgi:hypothetical protein
LAKIIRFTDADWYGLTVIAVAGVGAWLFRFQFIQPFWTVGACAAANHPGFCGPRAWVLWLQYQQVFGWLAFVLGLAAFVLGRRWFGVFAIAVGIAAVINYNATTGILGAALGLYAWVGVNTGRYKHA